MKILGLDVGDKRIGIAIADDGLVGTYGVVDNQNNSSAVLEITKICQKEKIEKIIIGLPRNQDSFQADKIHSFAIELAKSINLPIEYEDETLTSKEAERLLQHSKLDPASDEYKKEVDKLSAKLILEQFVEKS